MSIRSDLLAFEDFFLRATGKPPYPYQVTLTTQPVSNCVISVPTGCGKTAAVLLWWLYRRQRMPAETPRRLVYCLPTRALVEQTVRAARGWISNLDLTGEVPVYVLEGGQIEENWEIWPEQPAVIVGTQDLLLSRALNRGYAASPARWPIAFGLLNSDSAWVLDETQLMSSGLSTSAQLQAMREAFRTYGPTASIWMSATMEFAGLRTVDFGEHAAGLPLVTLQAADKMCADLAKRLNAEKRLRPAPQSCRLPDGVSQFVAEQHSPGTQTLVVVNRVERAREVFEALEQQLRSGSGPELLLVHSQFRPHERRGISERLTAPLSDLGRIVVSTQVVEAGVDITSALLVTDVAPWPSMVQRFGRCNRGGESANATVYWVDRPLISKQERLATGDLSEKDRLAVAAPYSWEETAAATHILQNLKTADAPHLPASPETPAKGHVLRRRDLLDLFDTSRDLSGLDIDVSRFVRDADDHDVFVAWRPAGATAELQHDELCPVPIGPLKEFLKKTGAKALCWDVLEGEWTPIYDPERTLRPGLRIILDVAAGGYDVRYGWSPLSKRSVDVVPVDPASEPDSMSNDQYSKGARISINDHTAAVVEMVRTVVAALDGVGLGEVVEDLVTAAVYHDLGKAHPIFQATVRNGQAEGELLAKSPALRRHARAFFRHELASALAALQLGLPDLAAYLVAAHHGKVRMTIRSLPGEARPPEQDQLFARGIFDGDELPSVELSAASTPPIKLNLEPMMLGRGTNGSPSWAERMLKLRDTLGPFRLAYLEALLRAADRRASAEKGAL